MDRQECEEWHADNRLAEAKCCPHQRPNKHSSNHQSDQRRRHYYFPLKDMISCTITYFLLRNPIIQGSNACQNLSMSFISLSLHPLQIMVRSGAINWVSILWGESGVQGRPLTEREVSS